MCIFFYGIKMSQFNMMFNMILITICLRRTHESKQVCLQIFMFSLMIEINFADLHIILVSSNSSEVIAITSISTTP